MWESLDGIEWADLADRLGTADELPALLRRFRRGDPEAEFMLSDRLLNDGGTVCPAASAALPFLVDMAADDACPSRLDAMEFVEGLAHEARTLAPEHVDDAWPGAFDAALPVLLGLIDHADATVRRSALPFTAYAPEPLRSDILFGRWAVEGDDGTRLDLIAAVGDSFDPRAEPLMRRLRAADDPQIRFAALRASSQIAAVGEDEAVAVAVTALTASDVDRWTSADTGGPAPAMALAAADLVGARRARFASALYLRATDPELRRAAVTVAGSTVAARRSSVPELLPTLRDALADPDEWVRVSALDVVAGLGVEAVSLREPVAALLGTGGLATGHAARFLVELDDDRCLPVLRRRIAEGRPMFGFVPVDEILAGHVRLAPELLSSIDEGLSRSDGDPIPLCRLVAAWGDAVAPVADALLGLADDETARPSVVRALGEIGPAARSAASFLEKAAAEGGPGHETAAWAHWRVTGDPGIAAKALGDAIREGSRAGVVAELLADVGGREHVPILLSRLAASGPCWDRLHYAWALWMIDADVDAVGAVASTLAGLDRGEVVPVHLAAIERLTVMRAVDGLGAALAAVALDDRLAWYRSPRSIRIDQRMRAAVDRWAATVA